MKASTLIKTRGWIQGGGGMARGPLCLAQALSIAHPDLDKYVAAYNRIRERAKIKTLLSFWNDQPERTVQEVIALLESEGL